MLWKLKFVSVGSWSQVNYCIKRWSCTMLMSPVLVQDHPTRAAGRGWPAGGGTLWTAQGDGAGLPESGQWSGRNFQRHRIDRLFCVFFEIKWMHLPSEHQKSPRRRAENPACGAKSETGMLYTIIKFLSLVILCQMYRQSGGLSLKRCYCVCVCVRPRWIWTSPTTRRKSLNSSLRLWSLRRSWRVRWRTWGRRSRTSRSPSWVEAQIQSRAIFSWAPSDPRDQLLWWVEPVPWLISGRSRWANGGAAEHVADRQPHRGRVPGVVQRAAGPGEQHQHHPAASGGGTRSFLDYLISCLVWKDDC